MNNNQVDIWQFMAYKIANGVAETLKIKLTYDMVKSVETNLRDIKEQYITKIYVGPISAKESNEINAEMSKLLHDKLGQPLNSGYDVIIIGNKDE